MLLIFDLDDTLIPTSRVVTPLKLRIALRRMMDAGLKVSSFEEAEADLFRINAMSVRSSEAIYNFVAGYKGDLIHLEIGMNEMYETFSRDIKFERDEEVNQCLEGWAKEHDLAIVTKGRLDVQKEKIERFGLPDTLFREIIVLEEGEKGPTYKEIAMKYGYGKEEIVVIGDRIMIDLAGAKELGYTTVHVKQGRGLIRQGGEQFVDHAINEIKELNAVIKMKEKVLERS